jgi:hypothetical protein
MVLLGILNIVGINFFTFFIARSAIAMLPLSLLNAAQSSPILVELKNGIRNLIKEKLTMVT